MQLCDYRETIVSVRISCDSGIAIKIFTHESATTAENLDFILILHVFLCGVCSWWSECERIQLCVMCWEEGHVLGGHCGGVASRLLCGCCGQLYRLCECIRYTIY